MMSRRAFMGLACAALASSLAPRPATAQTYPTRPVTLVIPFPPGGGNDALGRMVADKMSKSLGQQIVVDNRGGAGGTIATRAVARSTPDGYTILLAYTGTLAINPSLYANPGYDPRKDFAPSGLIAGLLLAPPGTPRDIIGRLNAALREALSADDVRARLAAEGAVPLPGTPADYAADIDTEETRWGALVRKLNLKVE